MQVSVTFRNVEATAALKRYAVDKVNKVQKYLDRPADAHVILFTERFRQAAEIVFTANGVPIRCMAKEEDMYAAIDGAVDKLDRQIRKLKEKRKSHRPPETRRAPRRATSRAAREEAPAAPPEPAGPVIVSTDLFVTESLTPEAAVAQLEKRGVELLLFKNSRNKRVNVVYRMPDGRFGLVEGRKRK